MKLDSWELDICHQDPRVFCEGSCQINSLETYKVFTGEFFGVGSKLISVCAILTSGQASLKDKVVKFIFT